MRLTLRKKYLLIVISSLAVLALMIYFLNRPYFQMKADLKRITSAMEQIGEAQQFLRSVYSHHTELGLLIANDQMVDMAALKSMPQVTEQAMERWKRLHLQTVADSGHMAFMQSFEEIQRTSGQVSALFDRCLSMIETGRKAEALAAMEMINRQIDKALNPRIERHIQMLANEIGNDLPLLLGSLQSVSFVPIRGIDISLKDIEDELGHVVQPWKLENLYFVQYKNIIDILEGDRQPQREEQYVDARERSKAIILQWKSAELEMNSEDRTAEHQREAIMLDSILNIFEELDLTRTAAMTSMWDVISGLKDIDSRFKQQIEALAKSEINDINRLIRQMVLRINRVSLAVSLVSLMIAVFGILVLEVIFRNVLGPVLSLRNAAINIGSGDFNTEVKVTTKDEIGELAAAFEAMRKNLSFTLRELRTEVTERTKAEQQLAQGRARLAEAQHIAHLGSWGWDVLKNSLSWSDEMFHIFGLALQEAPANFEAFLALVHQDDREFVNSSFKQALNNNAVYDIEHRIIRPDGSIRTVREKGKVELSQTGEPVRVLGTVQDITEQKIMEEEIRKAENLESLGVLAGGIAHDFNNLLQGLLGNISMAKFHTAESDKAFSFLKSAEESYSAAISLTNQLIAFAPGGITIIKEIQPDSLIRDSVTICLSGSNIQADYDLPDNLMHVNVDTGQLQQALNNIVMNAREAMPDGGQLTVRASNEMIEADRVQSLAAGLYVKISIKDRGAGIPLKLLPRIFDPYFSTKERGTQKGMGLGLSVSDAIIRKHDGAITVDSKIGTGTTFHIYLPAAGETEVAGISGR